MRSRNSPCDSGPGRPRGQSVPREPVGGCERDTRENAPGHEFVHQSDPQRLGGALALSGQDHVERGADADQPGKPLASAGAGNESELDLRKAELRLGVVGGDAIVAGERQLEAAAEAGAVDGGHDRLGEGLDAAQQLLALASSVAPPRRES